MNANWGKKKNECFKQWEEPGSAWQTQKRKIPVPFTHRKVASMAGSQCTGLRVKTG